MAPEITFMFRDARYAARNYDARLAGRYFNRAMTLHACEACCDAVNAEIAKERAKGFIDYSNFSLAPGSKSS